MNTLQVVKSAKNSYLKFKFNEDPISQQHHLQQHIASIHKEPAKIDVIKEFKNQR